MEGLNDFCRCSGAQELTWLYNVGLSLTIQRTGWGNCSYRCHFKPTGNSATLGVSWLRFKAPSSIWLTGCVSPLTQHWCVIGLLPAVLCYAFPYFYLFVFSKQWWCGGSGHLTWFLFHLPLILAILCGRIGWEWLGQDHPLASLWPIRVWGLGFPSRFPTLHLLTLYCLNFLPKKKVMGLGISSQ